MTQFYARENESLRARVAALETRLSDSAPKDTIPGSISASDETLVKRLQDAERRANDAAAQMTGMERAHLNALTALETSGRAAADAAADEQTELASALEKIRAELVAAVAARKKAEKDAVDARKDAAVRCGGTQCARVDGRDLAAVLARRRLASFAGALRTQPSQPIEPNPRELAQTAIGAPVLAECRVPRGVQPRERTRP